jgi:hypothetical protein
MLSLTNVIQDVMQVCRNGHVITDLLRSHPESGLTHCDRCGASTLEHCLTCGRELPGSLTIPGLRPLGLRQPPLYCPTCGAAFPWTVRPRPTPLPDPLTRLESMLRRLPLVARQLRSRQGDRPPFPIRDVCDLEDLVRALLPLQFDNARPECRTPRYAAGTRTDFLLAAEGIALTVKLAGRPAGGPELARQLDEDVAYYRQRGDYPTLVCFVHDPEGLLLHFEKPELAASDPTDVLEVRWVIGAP